MISLFDIVMCPPFRSPISFGTRRDAVISCSSSTITDSLRNPSRCSDFLLFLSYHDIEVGWSDVRRRPRGARIGSDGGGGAGARKAARGDVDDDNEEVEGTRRPS